MYDVKKLAEQYDIVEFYRESDELFSQTLERAALAAFADCIVVKYDMTHERLFPSGARSGMTEEIQLIPVHLRREGKKGESLKSLNDRLQLNVLN